MVKKLVVCGPEPLVCRNGNQYPSTNTQQVFQTCQGGSVILNVFQNVEKTDKIELFFWSKGHVGGTNTITYVKNTTGFFCCYGTRSFIHLHRRDLAEAREHPQVAAGAGTYLQYSGFVRQVK